MTIKAIIVEEKSDKELIWDEDGIIPPPRVWTVVAPNEIAALAILLERTGVRRGSAHTSPFIGSPNDKLLCTRIGVKKKSAVGISTDGLFTVTAHYGSGDLDQPEADDDADAVYSWSGVLVNEPIEIDINGNPIQTSAGEPFVGVTEEVAHTNLSIKNYQKDFSAQTIIDYTGAVCTGSWKILDPRGSVTVSAGQAYMRSIKRTPAVGDLFLVEYEVELMPTLTINGVNYAPFNKNLLDQGRYSKGTVTTANPKGLDKILDNEKKHVSAPVLLDGAGLVLGEGLDVSVRAFTTKKQKSFTSLGV